MYQWNNDYKAKVFKKEASLVDQTVTDWRPVVIR